MTYDPGLLTLTKVFGATIVGWAFQLGVNRLGQTTDTRTDIPRLSAITLTDGYEIGENGELSIDPMTGTATVADLIDPDGTDTVDGNLDTALRAGDRVQITYGTTVVQQGTVSSVGSHVEAAGQRWIRKTTYQITGSAGIMLGNTATWETALPAEPALTRLGRYFVVDTSLLTAGQVAYLGTITVPAADPATSSYLDLAREFTAATMFPVRASGPVPSRWQEITVIPAVTFQGALPPAAISGAHQWASSADFVADAGKTRIPSAIDVVKNYIEFISGFATAKAAPGAGLGSFRLAASPLGEGGQIPVGAQAPVVIDAFGTRLVASKVTHAFTSRDYRCGLEVTVPVSVG